MKMDQVLAAIAESKADEVETRAVLTELVAANKDLATKLTGALNSDNVPAALSAAIDDLNAENAKVEAALSDAHAAVVDPSGGTPPVDTPPSSDSTETPAA